MRPRDYVPIVLLVGIAGIFVVQGLKNQRDLPRAPRRAEEPSAPAPAPVARPGDSAGATTALRSDVSALAPAASAAPAPPARDLASIQTLIKEGSPGTYLMEMLAEQHDTLTHWPQRRIDAIRVFIDRYPGLPDFQPTYPVVVEHAFDEWREAGFPLRFDFVSDASRAEIVIRWVETLPADAQSRIGSTTRVRDANGWITGAEVVISTHDRETSRPLAASLIAGIARHELGHALGLGHSGNRGDVMFPESDTPTISRADRATLHLLYILPPGPVK